MPNIRTMATALACLIVAGCVCSCAPSSERADSGAGGGALSAPSVPLPVTADGTPRDYPGIHNAVAYHDGFISGSVPEGDEGFDTLAAMGIRTIISVDGAEPDVGRAAARGMRYIHLPIGYGGFDEQRKLQLVRATRDAMRAGPVYIHCHHGKHRSAGAAATVAASLGWCRPEEGVERMRVSGTAPAYAGLYACAAEATVLAPRRINAVPANFPAVSRPSGFVKGMVEVDEVFDLLAAIQKAGWTVPEDHPDLVPVAEAGRLADLYRTLAETPYARRKPGEFMTLLDDALAQARTLEDMLVVTGSAPEELSAQFRLVAASCKACHVQYRD